MRNLLKKPIFLKGNADWLRKLPSVIEKNNKTNKSSKKSVPIKLLRKTMKKKSFQVSKIREKKLKPKQKLVQLVRTAATKKVFSKGERRFNKMEI